VNVEPPLTPTMPKVGDDGKTSLHWGKLMSKPAVPEVIVASASAVLRGLIRNTAATRTAVVNFVKSDCTFYNPRSALRDEV